MNHLNPQVKKYLDAFYQMPSIHRMDPNKARTMLAQFPRSNENLDQLTKVEDCLVSVGENEEIKLRIYTPKGKGVFPIFVYYHGGGWVLGDLESADPVCRMIASRIGVLVVSVDYRLAPQYPFPIPAEDSYKALQWVKENGTAINGDINRIVVGGDSAGGNLAAAVSMMASDRNGPHIAAQVLVYPVTSFCFNTKSYHEFANGFGLERDLMIWFSKHYLRNEEDKKNSYANLLAANDLSMLPSSLIITAEKDVLRDEGKEFSERLDKVGVRVDYICVPEMIHGYFTNFAFFSEQIENSLSYIGSFLEDLELI
ncbi:alpha/beta hydrolase [Neobacillus niacini]|uniref:alpha/beta hydrolase n=1 Tax=Neobacillus niacini TaxID=86668 RepID=UPI0021CB0253|nr:alpha/beta hydrolase [Neobacillus niacini]MCM3766216.1 alpha/beta hydrolase [Neobacillus niacini]